MKTVLSPTRVKERNLRLALLLIAALLLVTALTVIGILVLHGTPRS
jgi:hypothetical protein